MIRLVAPLNERVRLDVFLARSIPQQSRSHLKRLIEERRVLVDGSVAKASQKLSNPQHVEVHIPPKAPALPQGEALPLDIVYQDADVAVVNKPPGLVTHQGAGHRQGTLVNALLFHLKDLHGVGDAVRPGIVHRLDKDTSGLLVVAKNDLAHRALVTAFAARQVKKVYLALVAGKPPVRGTWRTTIARHPSDRTKFTSRGVKGKSAVTHFTVVARGAMGAEMEVSLETGRTHQIRVHCADAGFPIFGDALYGGKRAVGPIARHALHAWKLGILHPRTGAPLDFEVAPPIDYVEARTAVLATP